MEELEKLLPLISKDEKNSNPISMYIRTGLVFINTKDNNTYEK